MNRIPDIVAALAGANCVRPPGDALDGLLLTSPINRRWATGFPSSAGAVVVTKNESVFITDARYIEGAKTLAGRANPGAPLHVLEIKSGQSYATLIREVLDPDALRDKEVPS